ISDSYDGPKLRTVVDGKKIWTPMLIVFVSLGVTDLMFAVDSIPAIFGITTNPFIVFTANLFALMGLRQLYFLLGNLLDRLRYLHYGVAFILAFIGVKLVLHAMHINELPFINGGEPIAWAPDIDNWMSLGVIFGSMAVATIASLIASSREPRSTRVEGEPMRVVWLTPSSDPHFHGDNLTECERLASLADATRPRSIPSSSRHPAWAESLPQETAPPGQ